MKHRAIIVLILLCLLPALAFAAETNRAKVAAMFADSFAHDYVLNSADIDDLWLEAMLKSAADPDARLFFLADLFSFAYNDANAGWSDETLCRVQLMQEGMVEDSQFNHFEFSVTDKGSQAMADFSPDMGHIWRLYYETRIAPDGSVWCLETELSDDRYQSTHVNRVMRFADGKIYWLTPAEPAEAEFYADGLPEYPAMPETENNDNDSSLARCEMFVFFEADTSTVPFKLTARLDQANYDRYWPAYICEPQCYLEFEWDGAKYVQTGKVCNQNDWGIFAPEFN